MESITLITDSACDLSCETLKKYDIKIIPLRINFSDRSLRDREDVTSSEIYEMLKTEVPKTSLPSSEDVESVFKTIGDATSVLYVGFSSGLSGTYNFIKMLGNEFFGNRFYSFDTKTLSAGLGLLVKKAAQMIREGKAMNDIFSTLINIRSRMFAEFVVKDITYLTQGGRINKIAGTIGSLLKISPVIRVNDDGVYETSGKSIGFSRSIQIMINHFKEKFDGLKVIVQVVHGMEENTARMVMDKINQFSTVVQESITPVTAALGVHTGPALIGIIAYEVQ